LFGKYRSVFRCRNICMFVVIFHRSISYIFYSSMALKGLTMLTMNNLLPPEHLHPKHNIQLFKSSSKRLGIASFFNTFYQRFHARIDPDNSPWNWEQPTLVNFVTRGAECLSNGYDFDKMWPLFEKLEVKHGLVKTKMAAAWFGAFFVPACILAAHPNYRVQAKCWTGNVPRKDTSLLRFGLNWKFRDVCRVHT
jgi:hypothetical protein